MGFADAYNAYLQKHAIRGHLVTEAPDPHLHTIIAIPAYKESGLITCLDSLFHCDPPLSPAEVIVLINSAKSSSREIVAANRRSYEEVREWIGRQRVERREAASWQQENNPNSELQENRYQEPATSQQQENNQGSGQQDNADRGQDSSKPQEKLRFHVVLVEDLPDKHFGAGLARKLVMDEAVRRLVGKSAEVLAGRARGPAPGQSAEEQVGRATKQNDSGIIVSLDADTVVRSDYLRVVEDHFSRHPQTSGCSISFEHPLSRQEYGHHFPPEVFEAVTNYELHQRYYLLAVRYTGYPYAFHTVGSCFAVQAEAYCRAGGMSRRKAGEDFYFIQKLAMQGGFTECRSTRVYPSPRPSDRVPFGTGPDIARQISTQLPPYLTYNQQLFEQLREFFELIPCLYRSGGNIATENIASENDPAAAKDGDQPAGTAAVLKGVPPVLGSYLEESGFWEELEEIGGNTASEEAFRKRFFNKFNMFRILKYLHYAEEHGVEKMEVTAAAGVMLGMWEKAHGRGMPDSGEDRPIREKDSPIREKDSPDKKKDSPESGKSSSTSGEDSPDIGAVNPENVKGSLTREMLLLYRKYFG